MGSPGEVPPKSAKNAKLWSIFPEVTNFEAPEVPSQTIDSGSAIYQNVGHVQEVLLRKFKKKSEDQFSSKSIWPKIGTFRNVSLKCPSQKSPCRRSHVRDGGAPKPDSERAPSPDVDGHRKPPERRSLPYAGTPQKWVCRFLYDFPKVGLWGKNLRRQTGLLSEMPPSWGGRAPSGATFKPKNWKLVEPFSRKKNFKVEKVLFLGKNFQKSPAAGPVWALDRGKKLRGRRPPRGTQPRRNENARSRNNLAAISGKVSAGADSHAQPVCPGETQKCTKHCSKRGISGAAVSKPRRPPPAVRHLGKLAEKEGF
jgi:hypothetical protein